MLELVYSDLCICSTHGILYPVHGVLDIPYDTLYIQYSVYVVLSQSNTLSMQYYLYTVLGVCST
jgi:hypothetical protein